MFRRPFLSRQPPVLYTVEPRRHPWGLRAPPPDDFTYLVKPPDGQSET